MTTYLALLEGGKREASVEVTRREPGRYEVRIGDRLLLVDARAHDARTLSLLVDGRSYLAGLDARGPRVHVHLGGAAHPVEILDERRLRLRRPAEPPLARGRQVVRAPLPGRIAKVLVKAGDAVTRGQPLVVLEALEMENELRSPGDGRVVELLVQDGQAVAARAELCAVE